MAGRAARRCRLTRPRQKIREDFGTVRTDYVPRDRDSFSFAYTIDDGDSLTPLSDPLFGSDLKLRSQVASLQEIHIFSPRALNTFRAGFSRAAFNFDSFALACILRTSRLWPEAARGAS